MAIVQISKIIHRIGAQVDLPQLDTGEIGFSTDTRQLFIGNDPILYPPPTDGTTQTEILTDQSSLDFARLNGSESVSLFLEDPVEGQILGLGTSDAGTVVTNLGGDAVTTGNVTRPKINLGNVSNVSIGGTAFNGAILQTDGTGNLSWGLNGLLKVDIANISTTDPAVVTTKSPHYFGTGAAVYLYDFDGMAELVAAASSGPLWIERLSDTTFSLYLNEARTSNVDADTYEACVANTGYAWGGIPKTGNAAIAGADSQIQFNDAGGFGAVSQLVFNKTTNNLTVTGNVVVNTGVFSGTFKGGHDGTVGATTPNTGAFTSITVSSTVAATGNITANNFIASSNGSGTNIKVGDDAYIGDVNVVNTLRVKGVQNSANGYIIFGDSDTTKLGRAGTGPLTYGGDVEITGDMTVGNAVTLDSWSLFANVDGLFATDGANTYSINMTQL